VTETIIQCSAIRCGRVELVILLFLVFAGCDANSMDDSRPTRLETFFPNVLNNVVQDPEDAARDHVYPEFTLNLEEASPEDRSNVVSVVAHWPDGRTTELDRDYRPQDGILRWVKHDLDRFDTLAPGGAYTFRVTLNTGEILEPVERFDQHLLGRPTDVDIRRTGENLSVAWTGPDNDHLWSVEIIDGDPSSGTVIESGPTARQAKAGDRVTVMFESPNLEPGTGYRVAVIMSDDSTLRSLKLDFVW